MCDIERKLKQGSKKCLWTKRHNKGYFVQTVAGSSPSLLRMEQEE